MVWGTGVRTRSRSMGRFHKYPRWYIHMYTAHWASWLDVEFVHGIIVSDTQVLALPAIDRLSSK